ncbi:MAG: ribosome biogenesis GTPase Der [Silvanigrellaceae bacterium]
MPVRTYTRLIAIVGRPNVGKSTLFNRIVKQRKSLVHDEPGVTRDRIFSRAEFSGTSFYLCDTGGFEPTSRDNIKRQLVEQAELAIEEADVVIFVTDAREGLHPVDSDLIRRLRRADKFFVVAANKCDLPKDDHLAEDFRKLGVEHLFPISAEHSRGVGELLETVTDVIKAKPQIPSEAEEQIKLAIIGRPNVGKSSILNRIAGETRSIVDSRPGTTRDVVDISVRAFGKEFRILDTAGIRRKSRMTDRLEKYSALRSVACLEECDVAVLVINADEGPTEGDARVAGYAFEMRKPILVVVNKWDLVEEKTSNTINRYQEELHVSLRYIRYAPTLFTSAHENQRISKILPTCIDMFNESRRRVSTSELNKTLRNILEKHTPPLTKNRSRRIKFFYATQVASAPPRFVIFCSDPKDVHFSYKRFLENEFREAFGFQHIPISIFLRERSRKVHGAKPEEDLLEMPKTRFDLDWDEEVEDNFDPTALDEAEIVYDDEVDA